jgi:lysine-specific histone demethylase 1
MENWNGISMKDTNVEQIAELLIPDQSYDNEEEKKDDRKDIAMAETDEHYVTAGDFEGPHCKVKTGMITVLKPFIKELERQQQQEDHTILCLGEEVVSIIDKKTHVRIEMASGKTIVAKCCVSTIPLGCLQHLISTQTESTTSTTVQKSFFQPKLCKDKIEAINSIWSGSYKKVFLTFDHIFWPKETPIIGLVRSEQVRDPEESSLDFPGRYLLLYNLWAQDNNIPSVEAILCGDLGKWAFQKSDAIIKQAVVEFIEDSMGLSNVMSSCIGCHVTRWEEDKYTRGSYSTFQLGTLDRHVDALASAEWDGRLVFAGEATENDHMGSVHAALISGKRAAKQVMDFLP